MRALPTKYSLTRNPVVNFLGQYEPENMQEAIIFRQRLIEAMNYYLEPKDHWYESMDSVYGDEILKN